MSSTFKEEMEQAVRDTETAVYKYLPAEEGPQKTIFEAMNYSMKAGGKRIRPLLDAGDIPDVRRRGGGD